MTDLETMSLILLGNYLPYDKYGTLGTSAHQYNSNRVVVEVPARDSTATWATSLYSQRLGFKVHIEMVAVTSQDNGSQATDVDLIPSADRWSDGTSKQKYWTNIPDCSTA